MSKFLECFECQSASSTLVSWLALLPKFLDCLKAQVPAECLQSAQIRQNVWSLFAPINKSVTDAELTELLLCQSCLAKIVHKWITLIYLNTRKQYPRGGVGKKCSRKQRQCPISSQKSTLNLYFPKHSLQMNVLKKNGAFFINITMDSVR